MKKQNVIKIESLKKLLRQKSDDDYNVKLQVRDGKIERIIVEELWDGYGIDFEAMKETK